MITNRLRVIDLFEKALDPHIVPFLSTAELLAVLKKIPVSQHLLEPVIGELLLRLWLYRAHRPSALSEVFYSFVPRELRDVFVAIERGLNPNLAPNATIQENGAWRFFAERANDFIKADGVIALTVGRTQPEALAAPFRFKPNLADGAKVQDVGGRILPIWSRQIHLLEQEWDEELGIQLQVVVPECMTPQGSSFALSVVLAKATKVGRLPQFQALSVIATGRFVGGHLRRIHRKQAKGTLATHIGAVFVAPGTEKGSEHIGIPHDMSLNNVIEFLNVEFARRGFGVMTPQQVNDAIRNLQTEIHEGRTSLPAAVRCLKRYSALLDESASKTDAGAILRSHVLRGNIANHMGNSEDAWSESFLAQACALKARDHRAYVDAVANEVVALADLGYLVEAEKVGRKLLTWVKEQMAGNDREQLQSEMIATGVLGGQPLLQLAVQGAPCGDEARDLLTRAFTIAKELELASEIARDSAQIVLWHALLMPEKSERAYAEADAVINQLDRAETRVSRAYLQNARFLGAYRRLLTSSEIASGFEEWELPNNGVGYDAWPYATALKYRGTLYATAGAQDRAEIDFVEGVKKLSSSTSTLLNFIGATAALHAAESLGVNSAGGAPMLKLALRAFEANQKSQPDNATHPWIERSLGLSNGVIGSLLPHPQLTFRY